VVGPFPRPCTSGSYVHRAALLLLKLLQPLAEIQRKVVYLKPQVVGPFPGPCASGSYLHWAAIVEAPDSSTVAPSSLIECSLYFVGMRIHHLMEIY
jgi:hypothetical protein